MRSLYVLYDADCEFCRNCRDWVTQQPAYVPVAFLAQQSKRAEKLFGRLLAPARDASQLIAITDNGGVYRNDNAWLIIFWALRPTRELSLRLAKPIFRPLTHRAYKLVQRFRHNLGWLTRKSTDNYLKHALLINDGKSICRDARCSTDDRKDNVLSSPSGGDG